MGIKFNCPTCGHKLNVKAFLSGKRGICPECDTKFVIPGESGGVAQLAPQKRSEGGSEPLVGVSTAVAEAPANSQMQNDAPAYSPAPAADSPAPAAPANLPTSQPAHPADSSPPATGPAAPGPAAPGPAAPGSAPGGGLPPGGVAVPQGVPANASPAVPSGIPAGQPVSAPVDPIAESPHSIWYVRPASGGQYGPATGDVFRQWISEGRVSHDSLVWREDWADWQQAGTALPQLAAGGGAMPAAAVSVPMGQVASAGTPEGPAISTPTASARSLSRRRQKGPGAAVIIMLALVAIVLAVVFGYVLTKQPSTSNRKSASEGTPATARSANASPCGTRFV